MKLYKVKVFVLVALSAALHSCLDLDPQDQLGGDNMWKSSSDYEQFANNFYGWTRDFSSSVYDGPHSDVRSDLLTYESPNEFSNGTNAVPPTDDNYTDNYKHIRRTNLLLQSAESYGGVRDEIKQYIGEAKFFRAYSYFDLVQLYGNVIIVKKPLDVTDPEMNATRNDRGEVVDFIVQDLNEAAEDLPLARNLSSEEDGRLSQEAAYAFLSRVALYEGTWQKFRGNEARGKELLDIAAKAAKKVMDSKQFELFKSELLGEASQRYMFILENVKSNPAGLTKANNKEYIFSRRHDETIAPINKNITKNCLNNVQWVTRKFANMFLCNNGLPVEKAGDVFQGYEDMDSEFKNRDNRMSNTLIMPGARYWNNTSNNCRVNWDATDLSRGIEYKSKNNSGYANQKWGTERLVTDAKEGYDYPIIRYAEVLLNYAEAVFERDDKISDDDLNISLNLVRQRVNPNMPALSALFVSANQLNMQEEIRRERTIELFNEGFRVDDLKRWYKAHIEMVTPVLGIKWEGTEFETWNAPYEKYAEEGIDKGCIVIEKKSERHWSDKNYLHPLPSDQRQLNPKIGQNPGWE